MRVTFLAKRIWSWYIRLFHIRSIPCSITPAHDTALSTTGFLATGADTQLKVTPTGPLLVSGWHKLTYDADHSSSDDLFVPKIYPGYLLDEDPTKGNNSPFNVFPAESIIHLRAHFPGSVTHFFHYDFDPEGFRFDPFELNYRRTLIPYQGEFQIEKFTLTYYGKVSYLIFCACNALHGIGRRAQKTRIRTAFRLFKKKGTGVLIQWLAHKAYLNLQPPFSPTLWYQNLSKRSITEARENPTASSHSTTTLSFCLLVFADGSVPEKLRATVDSALAQNYKISELIIVTAGKTPAETRKQSNQLARTHHAVQCVLCEHQNFEEALNVVTSDIICLAQSGDQILPQAIESLAKAMIESDADIAYGDEVIMEDTGGWVHKIVLRPGFCLDHFLNHPFTGMMTAVRRSLLPDTGTFGQCQTVETINENLILSALDVARNIVHVPKILYERLKAVEPSGLRRLPVPQIQEFLQSQGFCQASVKSTPTPGLYSIRYNQPLPGKTGIVIPTKNNGHILELAVESLEGTVPSDLYDLVIVNHESDETDTINLLQQLATKHRVIDYKGPFNFSRINNLAVECFDETISSFLFMNNDIEAIKDGWLENMRDLLGRQEVGIVGTTLLYPPDVFSKTTSDFFAASRMETKDLYSAAIRESGHKGTEFDEHYPYLIQHAGVMLNIGLSEHYQKFDRYRDAYSLNGPENPAIPSLVTRTFSAVTAACMLIRRDVFEKLDGFDDSLAVAFQDVDLCLRARNEGYRTICSAEAALFHHESVSRGVVDLKHEIPAPENVDLTTIDETDPHPADTAIFSERYRNVTGRDPCYPPMLSRSDTYYRPIRVPDRSSEFDDQVTAHENPSPLLM